MNYDIFDDRCSSNRNHTTSVMMENEHILRYNMCIWGGIKDVKRIKKKENSVDDTQIAMKQSKKMSLSLFFFILHFNSFFFFRRLFL